MSDRPELPEASRLPEDAERMGLTPLTAPGLQFASSLGSLNPRAKKMLLGLIAVIALFVLVVIVAASLS